MAVNAVPKMTTPRNGVDAVRFLTANANRDGTGTVATAFTAGADGSQVRSLKAKAEVATTAGMIRVFLHDGAAFFLFAELTVDAITPTASVATWEEELVFTVPLELPSGWSIRVSTHNGEAFIVTVQGGDY